jgi:hypothetical protein
MIRHWLLLLILASLGVLAACSGDEDNQPPRVTIIHPDPGALLATSPDSILVDAMDDRGIRRVDFFLDGELISEVTRALDGGGYSTRLPLGTYADGQEHVLGARATDSNGARSGTAQVTVTIAPSLQTVPQITSFAFDEGTRDLRLSWLEYPGEVDRYEWEVARDDRFISLLADGSSTDTTLVVATVDEGLAYARLRAVVGDEPTDWSRVSRFDALDTWRRRLEAPGPQLGTGIYQAPDGTLRVLSSGVEKHRVPPAPVQLLALDAENQLAAVHDLLDASHWPTAQALDADGNILLAGRQEGGGFVAAVDLDGNLLWQGTAGFMRCSALIPEEGGVWRTAGVDLRENADGGVFATVGDGGAITEGPTFPLEAGREVLFAWPRPEGGYVVAGQLPVAEDGQPGGIFVRGLDDAYQTAWDLRLGTGRRYLLRGGNTDGQGNFALTGIALVEEFFSRFAFIVGCDAEGRVRFLSTDRDWHVFAGVQPDFGGRWTVTGARSLPQGDGTVRYDLGLRSFSAAGLPLWAIHHQAGRESQGWALAPHPSGGWWVAGMRTDDYVDYDVDLLRVDDRGELE